MGGGCGVGDTSGYIRRVTDTDRAAPQLQVRGRSLAVAGLVAAVLLLGAAWAASIDLASAYERNSAPLEWMAFGYKSAGALGLAVVARRLHSRSMNLLALMLAALVVGSLLIDTGWFSSTVGAISIRLAERLPVSSGFLELGVLFLALGVVAAWLVYAAYRAATAGEKRAVLVVMGLLFLVGVFVGPVNAISALGINREWLFAEDFGQVVSLAVLVGYICGLVAATGRSAESPV